MTDYSRDDIELRIQVSVPSDGIFVLGHSLLNGADILGDSYDWIVYQDELVEVTHTRRRDVTSGIFVRPVSNEASITIRATDLDPNVNPFIHPNTKIKLEWKPVADVYWQNCLTGFMTDVQTVYNYNGGSLINIQAEDMMRRLLNAPITSYTQVAQETWRTLNSIIPIAITAAGLDDAVYTPVFNQDFPYSASNHAALSYSNTTAGQIINDLMDMELGMLYFEGESLRFQWRSWESLTAHRGYTNNMDSFVSGYSSEYLFSTIFASLTSAPSVVYTKTNTDVSSFFGDITQTAQLNLASKQQLDQWIDSIIQWSPSVRISTFSTPYFVLPAMNDLVYIINDFTGQTTGVYQSFVESSVYVDPTSVSTSMTLFQPV